MPLLAVDTALEACSVGIDREGLPPVLRSETIGRGHGERLFGMVRAAMAEAGIGFADLTRLAVTVGPGSFTGIRVGIAAIRGFALVTGRPAVGVTTLAIHAATARAMGANAPVLAVLDARAGVFYAQLFDPAGMPLGEPAAAAAGPLALLARQAGAVLAGSGAAAVAAVLEADGLPPGGRPPGPLVIHEQSAPALPAFLALARAAAEPTDPPRPLYLRPPDAIVSPTAALKRR